MTPQSPQGNAKSCLQFFSEPYRIRGRRLPVIAKVLSSCAAIIFLGHPFAIITPLYSTSSIVDGFFFLQGMQICSASVTTGCRIIGFPHSAHFTAPAAQGRQSPPVSSATQFWIDTLQEVHVVDVIIG
jgi:hypothetical protein